MQILGKVASIEAMYRLAEIGTRGLLRQIKVRAAGSQTKHGCKARDRALGSVNLDHGSTVCQGRKRRKLCVPRPQSIEMGHPLAPYNCSPAKLPALSLSGIDAAKAALRI
jgi:hypothetical protein